MVEIGQIFGELEVKEIVSKISKRGWTVLYARCKCSCGKEKIIATSSLERGDTRSCGHIRKHKTSERMREKLGIKKGDKFGHWKVLSIEYVEYREYKKAMCLCECTGCGRDKLVDPHTLKKGTSISCGCIGYKIGAEKNRTHGMTKTRLYVTWSRMNGRCYNENDSSYERYGARGISVCQEWRDSFEPFRDWALSNGYSDDLQIDRIDNEGNYLPENCRWTDRFVQGSNKRNNILLTYKGETKILAQWSREFGIDKETLEGRLKRGWSVRKAFETPIGNNRGRMIEFDGETMSVADWSRKTGITTKAIFKRLQLGWSTEKTLTTPVKGKQLKGA